MTALRRTVLPFAGFAVVIAAWWLTATTGITGKEVPTPGEVFAAAWEGLREPEGLLVDIRLSVLRVLIGVAVGCALSLPVGFALAWFPTLRAMFDPIINFCRALPPIALSPLVIIYVGIGEEARLLVLVWAAFFAVGRRPLRGDRRGRGHLRPGRDGRSAPPTSSSSAG